MRETSSHFVLINQHEHGLLSGEIAFHWGNESFPGIRYNLVLAASLHDYSWTMIDSALPWNDESKRPYDFINIPDELRLEIYQRGLDDVEKIQPYTALVTSLHYCSFFTRGKSAEIDNFLDREKERQRRLRANYYNKNLQLNLSLLQLFDNISLYLCLNKPGVRKENEHPWYKNGFETFTDNNKSIKISASWKNKYTVAMDPFPFRKNWTTSLRYSLCRKSLGKDDPDLGRYYNQHITFIPE